MFVYLFLILTHSPFFSPLVFKVVVLIDLSVLYNKCYILIFIYWVMEAKEEDDIIPEWWNVLSSISWHCQSRTISNQVHGIILPDQVKWASAVATAVSLELQCLILLFSHSSCLFALFLSVHRNQRSVQQPCHRLNVKTALCFCYFWTQPHVSSQDSDGMQPCSLPGCSKDGLESSSW